jgi:hypothetical protein
MMKSWIFYNLLVLVGITIGYTFAISFVPTERQVVIHSALHLKRSDIDALKDALRQLEQKLPEETFSYEAKVGNLRFECLPPQQNCTIEIPQRIRLITHEKTGFTHEAKIAKGNLRIPEPDMEEIEDMSGQRERGGDEFAGQGSHDSEYPDAESISLSQAAAEQKRAPERVQETAPVTGGGIIIKSGNKTRTVELKSKP